MEYIADLHIHSPYSRATSKTSHLFGLAAWAAVKGIQVVGTGDFTHPAWFSHLVENLEEAEPGFFRLKKTDQYDNILPDGLLPPDISGIRFVLTAEISSIYKRGGRVRKVHNIIFAPDLDSVRRINSTLAGIGNIESDGRPILGLDSRDLLEIVLEKAPQGFLVPAHIWTPWFSLFGSKSGFDSIEECFGDLSEHVFALETGLSSDPDMNRHISALDRFTLISNSDCHSPSKLGRECNVFTTGFDYFSMQKALRELKDDEGQSLFAATVEFYPEEGKYHCDGHRKCGVCMEPFETVKAEGLCPVCGRPVTVGVLNRVMELADRSEPLYPEYSPKVYSLVPLPELLGELLATGPATKKVTQTYCKLIRQFGSEFTILLKTPVEDLSKLASPILSEAIQRVRTGKVIRKPGFDGEFGVITVFSEGEKEDLAGQLNLFGNSPRQVRKKTTRIMSRSRKRDVTQNKQSVFSANTLNPEQEKAVVSDARQIIVKAGPGTGKTYTLVQRVLRVLQKVKEPCTVITFTNKAADELRQRIFAALDGDFSVYTATFHGYCLNWLRQVSPDIQVAGPDTRKRVLKKISKKTGQNTTELDRKITDYLQSAPDLSGDYPASMTEYFHTLGSKNLVDIDAVIPMASTLLKKSDQFAEKMKRETGMLFIDEFQDLNQSQYELVLLLAETSSVFAIGDPDQAIYGFRGSDPMWFSRFIDVIHPEQHFLYRNYRSPSQIVDASYALIQHNAPADSAFRPESQVGSTGRIHIRKNATPKAEANFVVNKLESLFGGTSHREIDKLKNKAGGDLSLADIAILYRTTRQADILSDTLTNHGFPVQLVDIKPFYQSGPVRLLYLWTVVMTDHADTEDFLNLLKLDRSLGSAELDALEEFLPPGLNSPLEFLAEQLSNCPGAMEDMLRNCLNFASELRRTELSGVKKILRHIVKTKNIEQEDPEVVRFLQLANSFGSSVSGFAEHLKKYGDSVVYDERAEAVKLMTIHAAKGLQFPVVFMVGLEEGILPLQVRSECTQEDINGHLQEERRLFYVGMTRAEKILYLSYAENRQVKGEMVQQKATRFLKEIPEKFFTPLEDFYDRKKIRHRAKQLRLF